LKRKKPNPNPKLRCKGVGAYLIAADRIPGRRVREEDLRAHRMSPHIGVLHRWSLQAPPQGATVQTHRSCTQSCFGKLLRAATAHRRTSGLATIGHWGELWAAKGTVARPLDGRALNLSRVRASTKGLTGGVTGTLADALALCSRSRSVRRREMVARVGKGARPGVFVPPIDTDNRPIEINGGRISVLVF
jgi:hypothetical protein